MNGERRYLSDRITGGQKQKGNNILGGQKQKGNNNNILPFVIN
ncbi:hypothetical protein LTSEHVI_0114 [Salmonella enterica subsp. enterica serovar Hvittingfoss str. A4-620]|nr:hypothetical protein LTSEHVI_0114 [Salmonella enterica subsp. enterica serovar Hvittingfoss str. A4-620]